MAARAGSTTGRLVRTVTATDIGDSAASLAATREHVLTWRRPVAGGERTPEGWCWRWRGAAVMAIVNVTPDSFSDGGATVHRDDAVAAGRAAWRAGAALVDVGGVSTRPGSEAVPSEVELDRVLPVLHGLRAAEPAARISVDTSDPEVASAALAAGADLVNDVRGLRDAALARVVADAGVPAVIMHMQGEPRTMQDDPRYADVVAEVAAWLESAARSALAAGVPSVVIDPGLGFGKRPEHNRALLLATDRLAELGWPLLVGISRKGTLGEVTGELEAARRDPASLAAHLEAARRGAALVRAHDVRAHVQGLAVQRWLDG
jgi:dihydropteroate synthase